MSLPILHFGRMPWPTDWTQVFGRDAPLLIELGFGGGDNLVALAKDDPSSNVLGIEISLPSLKRGARKLSTANLANARVLQGDSRAVLSLLFRAQTISSATINFPDPWPKAGHQRRRLINRGFLELLATRMIPEAHLDIATDHEEYATVIEKCLAESPYFESRSKQPFLLAIENRRQTKYERIALAEGRPPRYFIWKRNKRIAVNDFPIPEEIAVPHVVLFSSLDLDKIGDRFEPFHVQEEDIHIKYLNMYRSLDKDVLLMEIYVNEDPFQQRIALSIRGRPAGDLVISVYEIGFPRPTRGIHLAVQHLVSWLKNQDSDLAIVNSTLMQQADHSTSE